MYDKEKLWGNMKVKKRIYQYREQLIRCLEINEAVVLITLKHINRISLHVANGIHEDWYISDTNVSIKLHK